MTFETTTNTQPTGIVVASSPSRGTFSIYLPNTSGSFNLSLINIHGQLLKTWKNSNSPGKLHEFDITGIAPGIYIASLKAAGRIIARKILISQ
jgi:hypothetical protein